MKTSRRALPRLGVGRLLATVGALIMLAGCSDSPAPTTAADGSSGASSTTPSAVAEVASIAANVPAGIAERGTLIVGADVGYEPYAFVADGEITGFDVDLITDVARVLGVTAEIREAPFAGLFTAVADGRYDTAIPALTDTVAREKIVDFVTYYSAGNQWARVPGTDIEPGDACGRTVAVKKDTYQDTVEVAARSKVCVAAGKKPIIKARFDTQDQVVDAVLTGRAAALSADAPVTTASVAASGGRLQTIAGVFASAPYGFPVAKGSTLVVAIQQAVQHLIDTGRYAEIAQKWDLGAGMVPGAIINGAVN
ncbi:transporter substrate-binding domain-containing protein [Gordonia desulfuricans]|uniref:Transporter substrate-binding domain-containing protein n=1 Tax=Gordonia desulfuricans TaxID=89051 RepID=A0A7K3LQV0_9ACTN|nr:transporter substrate-binding domain-containing protein [Gordonia desulfuricans]NDK90632.1 transporter substrate-binding domain-containing protein [Gordonia desulfuricans]